ncbi:uncharacterized protein LOC123509931 isoform X2 [Portunus trituberculatus]|uniref:uncharacterized protein LOC123509931 isoform X2 n=1 Tax=Portunus trituberculatus TaxID=210409 RepID=UPI001E1CFC00|nr:uncharacterized protein LOC123509931 isoform X2 [Portunus trituberculatus]
MKVSIAAVLVHTFSFVVSTGEALGQLTEERGGGQDLDAVVDSVNAAELQQTTRYTGSLQDSEDGRSKAQGGNGGSGGRRHHNNHGPRRHQDCNNNDIAECVELLEVLTNKDLGFAATVDELNKMCPVLLNGLQCIDNYTRRCLTQKHRDYFNKLYAGTIRVIKDLCNTRGRYQEEYIRHAPCMRQVNPKYNVCSVTYHRKTVALNDMQDASVTLSEDEKNRNVIILCCSFQEYLQCSERVVFETCGNETALFTKEFLDRMAGPIVQGECSSILNMYQCPEDLFPLHHEGSPRPNSSTTDPSSSPAPQPTPTTRRPGCAKTLQDEAEIQGPAAASAPAPTPTPILEIGMLYTHGTTQRTLTTMATLAGALDRVGEGGAAGDASPFRGPGTETAAAFRNHTTFKCTKYAPGSQVCETAGSSGVNKASLLPLVAMLLILRQLLV